jgi:hypothetical protein
MRQERWDEFVYKLDLPVHRLLLLSLRAGLRHARMANEVATGNLPVEEARGHLRLAITHLTNALEILETPPTTGAGPGTSPGGDAGQ